MYDGDAKAMILKHRDVSTGVDDLYLDLCPKCADKARVAIAPMPKPKTAAK